ncbi:hypothetical protein CDD80_1232 [Ophiocordyceps camponoti-rufipedis]|uniref:Uncharacterized protein n=1 Tax=Ophiocordyceps camponoti-rufipedis TaxID=2004952 RepID=A0A2C5Y3U7_9HYPO|nr:hypothetical protein CDD80_1232 [Ophiocordyceps camponoti-rufipedis]
MVFDEAVESLGGSMCEKLLVGDTKHRRLTIEKMGKPSVVASDAVIYTTFAVFLLVGTAVAWRVRGSAAGELLSSNGRKTAFPLALNLMASALGAGILFAYPEMATVTGLQGLIIYAVASALPLLLLGFVVGPAIRRRCPSGFVLTQWTEERYGREAMVYLSLVTLATLFLYMVAELSAMGHVVEALTGTGKGVLLIALLLVSGISVGVSSEALKPSLLSSAGLLSPSLLGWQLLYILPVAITTNAFFLSSFWLRIFASRTDADLRLGSTLAAFVVACVLAAVGATGLVAVGTGAWPESPEDKGSRALFALLERLPAAVVCLVLVMVVCLSTAMLDSLQSAMVSSASNDIFGNRLAPRYVRGLVIVVIVPVIIVALKGVSVLQIYLISDLLSAATIPILCLGLLDKMHWLRGTDVIAGGLGGLFSVFVFGWLYLGSAAEGGKLLILEDLYSKDWRTFGAFAAAPLGEGGRWMGC